MENKTCETCRYISKLINVYNEDHICWQCKFNPHPTSERKGKLSDNWLPKARIPCTDCEIEEGIWEITFLKEMRGTYGKKDGLYCNRCLNLNMEGYHSGGGWNAFYVEKITRKRTIE